MDDLMNLFKKSSDYNPDVSFDNIVKSWEENFLGNGKHNETFSHSMESDNSFENANVNSNDSDRNLGILPMLFDQNLKSDFHDGKYRKELAQNSFEFIKMTPSLDYYHCWTGGSIELSGHRFEKFMFIIIRQHEQSDYESGIINQLDEDVDITQFPCISGIEFYNNEHRQFNINLENIWTGQFDNMVIYGVAMDGVSDMSNWIKVLSEGIESTEKLNFDVNVKINSNSNEQKPVNNLNSNNYEGTYLVSDIDNIKISLYNSNVPVNIEIIHITQNIQKIFGGMCGDAYCE
jgi:hypothetical protein